jgi:hypothetical protein
MCNPLIIHQKTKKTKKTLRLVLQLVIPNYSILNYSITRNFFFKDPGYPGDSISSIYSLSLSVFTYFSFLFFSLFPFISFSLSLLFCLHFRFRLYLSIIKHLKFQFCKYMFFFQIEKAVLKSLKLMLDYSKHLLKLSSIQKFKKMSEHRVLDTRPWNH